MPQEVGERLGGVVTEFVAALVNEPAEDGSDPPATATGRERLVPAIRRYIDRNLGDPELSPERIAAAHSISVRCLHRLFETGGVTVGRLIQQRRVERCERELTRRGQASPSVTAVALRWGFRSPAHFSRAFKAVHGHSPRQWRAGQRQARNRHAVTGIVEVPGRGHALTIDHGWREVADVALAFVRRFTDPAGRP